MYGVGLWEGHVGGGAVGRACREGGHGSDL